MTDNHAKINARSYNRIADWWDENRKNRPTDPMILKLISMLPEGACVLDVGCGTGRPIARALSENGFSVTGIDPAENMLKKAEKLNLRNAEFFKTDLLSYVPDKTFDAVIAFDSVFHISLADQPKIYPKIAKLLNPSGLFLFTHGKMHGSVEGEMQNEPFLYAALDKTELKTLLHKENFEILQFTEDYKDPITGTRDLVVIARKGEMKK
ncbi:MAG: methyltransferase domain-containing protein [Clostridiales bacterium]|nr:methyltransferase domain-containing protein [Clostridiales bacterium]